MSKILKKEGVLKEDEVNLNILEHIIKLKYTEISQLLIRLAPLAHGRSR